MTIKGTVVDAAGALVSGAIVQLYNLDTPAQTGFTTSTNPQTTVADGKYLFMEVPEGKYKIVVTIPGYGDVEIKLDLPKDMPPAPGDMPIVIPISPTITINQQPQNIVAAINDTAVFSVDASVAPTGIVTCQWYKNSTASNSGGTAITGATLPSYRAATTAKGTAYYYCEIKSNGAATVKTQAAQLTVRNTPVGSLMTIEGVVYDDSTPAAPVTGATVTLSPAAGTSENPQTTEADGRYRFENLPEGRYTVTVVYPNGGKQQNKIIINDGEITPSPADIILPKTNSIKITRQPSDIELTSEMDAGFMVEATATKTGTITYQWYKSSDNSTTSSSAELLTGETGAVLSLGKQAVGESYYYCIVSSPEAKDVTSSIAKLTVTQAPDKNGDINGVVTGDDNSPLGDVAVKLMKNGTNGVQFGKTVYSDENGNFKFSSVPYGSYSLVGSKNEQVITKQINIKAPVNSASIMLPAGNKTTTVVVAPSTPSAAVDNLDELFTERDLEISSIPGATVELTLKITQVDAPADKSAVDSALADNQHTLIFLDAQLLKSITGTPAEDVTNQVTQPAHGQKLKIVLDLPDNLQNKQNYKIIRVHNGAANIIDPVYDPVLQTLTFDGDAFSTYAVVSTQYTVTVVGGGTGATASSTLQTAGDLISLSAGTRSGYKFSGWAASDGVNLSDKASPDVTFDMPAKDVTLTAGWTSTGGGGNGTIGGGGGGGGGGDYPRSSSDESSSSSSGESSSSSSGESSGSSNGSSSGGTSSDNYKGTVPDNSSSTSSDSSSGSSSGNSSSPDDNNNLDDVKDRLLKELDKARDNAVNSLPTSLTEEQRTTALAEIEKIYTDGVNAIENAQSQKEAEGALTSAEDSLTKLLEALGGEAAVSRGKPFVVMNFAFVIIALLSVILTWKRNGKQKNIIGAAASAGALAVCLFTMGFDGVLFASLSTIPVGILSVVPVILSAINANKET